MSKVTNDEQRIEQALEKLFVKNPDFHQLEESFDLFCPFEAVGMIEQEIRHAHFLSYITDPRRPHGFGTGCLRALLHCASADDNNLKGVLSLLDVHLMSFEGAIVRREWRNIDLLIEFPNERLIVTVELKINATEGGDQLERYRETVLAEWPAARGWRHAFLFLSKRGEAPSEAYGADWTPVPLLAFANELDEVVARELGNRDARELLRSYLNMLRRRHLQNTRLEQIARKLWSEHREALTYLIEQQPDVPGSIFAELRGRLGRIASAVSANTGMKLVEDESNYSYLRLAVEDWDRIPGLKSAQGWTKTNRLVLIEIVRKDFIVKLELGRGDALTRERVWDALVSADTVKSRRKKLSRDWKLLSSQSLSVAAEEQELTAEAVEELVIDWLSQELPAFNEALSKLAAAQTSAACS